MDAQRRPEPGLATRSGRLMSRSPRAVVLVLDSVGVGALPDADSYGDADSNTLGNISRAVGGLSLPNLGAMGLGNIIEIEGVDPSAMPSANWGLMAEASAGKDTTTGHWELMGLRLGQAFPTYPQGFPRELLDAFTQLTGEGWLGNRPASGTEIIQALGDAHVSTGKPIIYTSADSVFQIAAHEQVMPVERLYEVCRIAREYVCIGEHAVGRIIARPFLGPNADGHYTRTHRRRDFALKPTSDTVLDLLAAHGIPTHGIGKIGEIFAWKGVADSPHSESNMHGFDNLLHVLKEQDDGGFVFANLVDFDMLWGHRNDVEGYARGLEELDTRIPELLDALEAGDLLIITADHGCDPTTPSTDHSREHVPLLALVQREPGITGIGRSLSLRRTFGDVGRTVLDFYGVQSDAVYGTSFLTEVLAS